MLYGLAWMAGYFATAAVAIRLATRPGRARRHADRVAAERAARFGDTIPGTDQAALDTCNAIWNETETRKEDRP